MTFIQRVRFIHNEFSEICRGERSNVDVKFQKQCCMEIRFPLDDENTKEFALFSSLCEQKVSAYMPSWALLGMTAVW
jgi:hypothetical protein